MDAATRLAIETPLRTMEVCVDSMATIKAMAEHGNPASVSDAGVGALCARSGVIGAELNVRINAKDLEDEAARADYVARARDLRAAAEALEIEILGIVESKI